MNKDFLLELLATPSPSGAEMEIQHKWMDYVSEFADEMRTDHAGNVIGILNPEAEFKVLLAGHSDEIGFMVKKIDDKGFIRVEKLGGISHKPAIGMKVTIFGTHGKLNGVFGVNAEHHGGAKGEFTFDDLYIDCGATSKAEVEKYIEIGDLAVYKREVEFLLNDRISGRGLDNRTGSFIVAEVLKEVAKRNPKVGVYAVSTVNEETNMGGAYFAGAGIKPTMAIACDVTFASDYPGIDSSKHTDVKVGGGPVIAKGAPINIKVNQMLLNAAKKLDMAIQYELTPRMTGTDADKLRLTGEGVPVSLLSLPLRYMHAPVETVSLKDMEEEIALLVEMIADLTGEESVNPLTK
ncbi:M20/M25/M40 family metallo-hydrolase [Alkalihalobacillus sp. R86527]|uniref:M20/M25/M40 family metallo-hydrolase n=1 Tax=Alkalihalobacillus sp. R86527 TaxID=3093863 RepID=UPI0036717077